MQTALAAVGLTESVLEIIYAIAVGLAMATTAVVARRFGEKDKRAAARTAVQAIYIGVALSIVFGAIGAIWAPDILRLMGADEATVARGYQLHPPPVRQHDFHPAAVHQQRDLSGRR